ncbi:MAG: hypothetical protein K6A92_11465 [Lachnospiraceae bacterium]|nr:hypothetical protein [Lachnospiraceae bacterium]
MSKRNKRATDEKKNTVRSALITFIVLACVVITLGLLYMTFAPKLRIEVTQKVIEQLISGSMGGSVSYDELMEKMEEEDRQEVEALVEKYATDENISVMIRIYQESEGNFDQIESEARKILEPEDMETIYRLIDKYQKMEMNILG